MLFINLLVILFVNLLFGDAAAKPPEFRILAPPFICPKDEDAVIEKPENTVITLQTEAAEEVEFQWIVRWEPLVAPTQKFTLELWRTVRELEEKLNSSPTDANAFIINNSELLSGVNYIFNVSAVAENEVGEPKVFHIDNIKGDPKLLLEGQSDRFSIFVVGGQRTFADIDFMIEAQVTSCTTTHDYYFVWTVTSAGGDAVVWDGKGAQLLIRANTLTPGVSYDVLCQVYKYSNGDFITQANLPFRVLHRNLSINFNVDLLYIPIDTPFSLYTDLAKLDYLEDGITIEWICTFGGETVAAFYETDDEGTLSFPTGLPDEGEYIISLTVNVVGQSMVDQAIARVIVVPPHLPVIKVLPTPRVLNEESVTELKANITNVSPGCSVTWYFRSAHCLVSEFSTSTDICVNNEHGTQISEPVNFYSLEQNFLSELTDYTNETGWKSVAAMLEAAAGRARVVAECGGCDQEENCTVGATAGVVYADIMFKINDKPMPAFVMVIPEYGTAMETIYRVSTTAVVDTNGPLRYSFYCDLKNNDTMLLGSYVEHLATETLLPYIDNDGTFVWVEVCDSLGACSPGAATVVPVAPGDARTVDALLETARAHVKRCEVMLLRRLTVGAVVTYKNAAQPDALSKFTTNFLNALGGIEESCIEKNYDQYYEFMYWLQSAGIDTTKLL